MYLDDEFKEWIQPILDEYHVPGMSVAVVHDGKVEAAGYGLAVLPDIPATAETIYSMGSTTKAFLAAVVGLLIEESKQHGSSGDSGSAVQNFDWDTPVKSILGHDFEASDPYVTANASFEDMLSHRTGIPGHDYLWGPWLNSPAGVTQVIRYLDASQPFRGGCQYNNIVYGAVGHAVEKITGQSWGDVLRQRILKPLGMHKTYNGVEEASEVLANDKSGDLHFARGYHWVDESNTNSDGPNSAIQPRGYYIADPGFSVVPMNPAGANLSTVLDYAKWASELLRSSVDPASRAQDDDQSETDKGRQSQLISNAIWKQLTTPRTFWPHSWYPEAPSIMQNSHATPASYALAWLVDPYIYPGQLVIRHSGGLPSFGAEVALLPNLNLAIIAVANTEGTSNKVCTMVVKEIVGRVLDVSKEDRDRRRDQYKSKKGSKEGDKPQYHASSPNFAHDELKLTAKSIDSDHQPSQSEDISTFYKADQPISMSRTFRNPSYGSFVVQMAPQSMGLSSLSPMNDGVSIIRKHSGIRKKEQTLNDVDQPHAIHIRPMGNRSIKAEHILHPSAVLDGKIVYDLERIVRHGLPDEGKGDLPDPFASLPPGHGKEDDPKYSYRKTQVWASTGIQVNGAVLLLRRDDQNDQTAYTVEKIGLALARLEEPKGVQNGVLDVGWEKRLVWFTPTVA